MGSMQDKVRRKGEEENGSIPIKVEWGAKDDKQQIKGSQTEEARGDQRWKGRIGRVSDG